MQEQMESWTKNNTQNLVKLPKEKKIIRCKWMFKRKEDTSRAKEARHKAWLVAKDYN